MPSLPVSTDLTGSSITEAQAKTWFTQLRDFLSGLLGTAGTISTALAALQAPFGQGVEAKTGAYTVVAADRGKVLSCSGTWTLALTAAATLGNGFMLSVVNTGSGVITIDPSGAETIDWAATFNLGAGLSIILVCTGTGWVSATKSTTPYVEPTLAAGSSVYKRWDLEKSVTGLSASSYPATLAAYASDAEMAVWQAAAPGNMFALRADHAGIVTASVDHDTEGGTGTPYARFVLNGVQQEEWSPGTAYATKTRNITVAKGDVLQVQVRVGSSDRSFRLKNFRLLVATLP